MIFDWHREIAIASLVKEKVRSVDEDGIYPFSPPRPPATEAEIDSLEATLGFPVDRQYRSFLLAANGWPAFFQTVDLLGTTDLISGERLRTATLLMVALEDLVPICGYPANQVFPIAVASADTDLFLMPRRPRASEGEVIWIGAGQQIERFISFQEYFLSMVDYNRREVRRLEGTLGAKNVDSQ